jgi:hypothetical protein
MLKAILGNDEFDKTNPLTQNLITVVESKIRHPPRTEENYNYKVWVFYSEYLLVTDIIQ